LLNAENKKKTEGRREKRESDKEIEDGRTKQRGKGRNTDFCTRVPTRAGPVPLEFAKYGCGTLKFYRHSVFNVVGV
jgi:hypothetical protein